MSILEDPVITRAMGGNGVRVTHVLLTADETTVRQRPAQREIGTQLAAHIERGLRMARQLDAKVPAGTIRVPTDGLTVLEIAAQVLRAASWTTGPAPLPDGRRRHE